MIFDSRLSFEQHIKSLCARLNGTISYLNRVKNTLDQKSRILLINALIFSHLNYCSSIWGKWSAKQQNEVQICINFAAKVASNGKYLKRDHVTPLLRYLNYINSTSILRLNKASFMYKNLKDSTDSNVKKIYFDLRNKVSQRITRNGFDVHIDYRRTAVWQKAVSVSSAKLWNSIPMNIRNSIPSLSSKVICTNTSYNTNNHMGTNPNFSNKKFDLRQFLHIVKEFDLFEKYVNKIMSIRI